MATHERIRERGRRKGDAAELRFIEELRIARTSLGLSQATAASIAGIDRSTWTRIEERRRRVPTWSIAGQMAAAVGLDLSVGLYPSELIPRDTKQSLLSSALHGWAGPGWGWRSEVHVAVGDQRAWDQLGTHRTTGAILPAECESMIGDAQALCRRLTAKREAAGGLPLLLVVRDTHRNRASVRIAADVLYQEFPLPARTALELVQDGRSLPASSLVFLRPAAR